MAVYHQMGHDSWNLIDEKSLHGYAGIVLSPVNDSPANVVGKLAKLGKRRKNLEVVLDPQFYKPSSDRGQLLNWGHFADDVDTANLSDISWWDKRLKALVKVAGEIGANAVCSPAFIPRVYDDEYYLWSADCAQRLQQKASKVGLSTLLTVIVRVAELAKKGAPQRIASILTRNNVDRAYLVLFDDLDPRTQRTDYEALGGAISLIRLLEQAETKVLVAFSGLDMLLWKAGGAWGTATGKFFNLRRFVPGRFEDTQEGGRQLPYWTDSHLITWLREDDVRLLDENGLIDREDAASNPYAMEILAIIDAGVGEPWIALGWRQYLHWFMETEHAISLDRSIARRLLRAADTRWGEVSDNDIYLFDRQNSGNWIRPWLNAIRRGLADE